METYSSLATRTKVRTAALLFGSNSMYDLLCALAVEAGTFHGAALSRRTGYGRKQVQAELRKLGALGIVEPTGMSGRKELFRLGDDPLTEAVLDLPALLDARLTQLKARGDRTTSP